MQVNSIKEACEYRGYSQEQIEAAAAMMPPALQKFIRAVALKAVVIEALNDGQIPDHKNYNQVKYEPIFDLSVDGPSGLGLAFRYTDDWDTITIVGARLQILKRDDSDFFGRHEAFQELHHDSLTYKPVQ